MATYIFPIKAAIITFPVIAFLLTIPFLIYQYRVYGYVNKLRAFIIFSFLLYLIVAFYLVILPLPESRDIISMQRPDTEHYNLRLFRFIEDIKSETKFSISQPSSYKFLFTERAFLQVVFNAILLLPLGMYLRYYFRFSFKKTIIASFLVSLFFEITQLTGLYGIYNAPYRLFDVDDLMLNTLGAMIGYGITPIFAAFLPESDKLDDGVDLADIRVGYIRRFIGYFVDITLVSFIPGVNKNIFTWLGVYIIYFIIIVYLTNGRTIGKWLTNVRIVGEKERLSFKEVLYRNGILYIAFIGTNKLITRFVELNQSTMISNFTIIVSLFHLVFNIFIAIHILYSIVKRERFFYEKISNTYTKVSIE